MKWILPLLLLCGCATLKQDLKPLPAQSAACVKSEASASTAVKAAQCLSASGGIQAQEACWESLAEGMGLDILQCEAVAFWQDIHQAAPAAQAIGNTAQAVQLSAGAYLQAKGVTVTAP